MDHHVKIEGICVGMSKAEVWEILKNRAFKCELKSISTIGTTSFCKAQVSITYMFDSAFKVYRILILWTKKEFREGSIIGKVNLNDMDSVYGAFVNHFMPIMPVKEVNNKIYSKQCEYVDLYNSVRVYKQDSRDEGNPKFDCVTINITDFTEKLNEEDRALVYYARNAFVLRSLGDGYWISHKSEKSDSASGHRINKKDKKIIISTLVAIVIIVLTYFIASSYRYDTFKDKNRYMRYDKWEQIYEKYDQHSKKWIRNY